MTQNHNPFHLKYRPQNFTNIIGQNSATNYLQLAIAAKKITFAYLFVGQHGSGKTTLARVMAKAINCTSSKNTPCNVCENCVNIHLGRSFDFYEIDAAKNTGIENIREIIEKVQYSPIMSKYKVCIIDEAHMLSINAFNSLLKTLESPPINTVFILSTTAVNKIPNTIISRCQKLYFQPIRDHDLIIGITKVVYNEKLRITNKGIENLIKITKGSFRDALNIVELFSVGEKKITAKSLSDKYLIIPIAITNLLIEKVLSLNILEVLTIIDYIQFNNWNEEDVIDSTYNQLVTRYINNKKMNSTNKSLFVNTKRLVDLLECLGESKFRNKKDFWLHITLFIIKSRNKYIYIACNKKRQKIQLHIQKNRIYSN
uniref:DNA-directed DNA polymerase n=2 Tax=Cryptophyceae TaxID=3027 RepID=A9LL99_9CRYP|nr:DNA polymerase III [Rhodomonas salina]ABO70861.1 DNA polymerase III [Rhodomonas salina]ABX10862.1 DNA polymerase III gamma and tau subunits [Rhodomonas baltica]